MASLLGAPAHAQDPGQNVAALNFAGADIESVIKAIGHYTGTTFIIDPRVKGQINLVSEKPLSKEQAFKLLTSTLRLQGYAVVSADGYTKVVPEADAKLQPGPTHNVQVDRGEGVKGDQVATQVYKLNYESATNIVTVLRPLISPNNTINANPGNNSVVITDYADNLKRLNKIIAALDMPATVDLDVIPVKHAIASDLAAIVNKLTESSAGAGDAGRAILMADTRTNSILLKAPSAARANLIKALVAKLDVPTALPGNVHVVYLKNAEAVKLAATLRSLVTGEVSQTPAGSGGSANAGLGGVQNPAFGASNPAQGGFGASGALAQTPQHSAGTPASGGAAGFIQADAATNTLIITASEAVYRNLRSVIDQLDARRAQVYVEALIVEVSADKSNDFGIQWMGISGDKNSTYRLGGGTNFSKGGDNILGLVAGNATTTGSVLPGKGLSLGLFRQVGGQLGLGALAHALESDGNSNILSIPNVVTLDNETATIKVGKNVPFITGQFTTAASGSAAGVNPFQTIERKDVGLKLSVRPQISEGGTVKLTISQEVSSVDDATNSSGIITKQRSIETNVLIDDGQILALGGLIEDSTTDGIDKVNGLGDLPVIGNLFKYQSKKRGKSNLMVFLRPTVIRSSEQSNNVSLDRYDYMRTQLMPTQDAASEGVAPKLEKGKLMTTPFAVPEGNAGAKESK